MLRFERIEEVNKGGAVVQAEDPTTIKSGNNQLVLRTQGSNTAILNKYPPVEYISVVRVHDFINPGNSEICVALSQPQAKLDVPADKSPRLSAKSTKQLSRERHRNVKKQAVGTWSKKKTHVLQSRVPFKPTSAIVFVKGAMTSL